MRQKEHSSSVNIYVYVYLVNLFSSRFCIIFVFILYALKLLLKFVDDDNDDVLASVVTRLGNLKYKQISFKLSYV